MVFQPMVMTEIGRGGATVETRVPLLLNSLHTVRVTLGDTCVVLQCRVVHSSVADLDRDTVVFRSGLEFVDPAERVSAVIVDYVESVKAGRAAVAL